MLLSYIKPSPAHWREDASSTLPFPPHNLQSSMISRVSTTRTDTASSSCADGFDAVRRQPRKAASADPLDDWRGISPKVPLHSSELAADRFTGCRSIDTTRLTDLDGPGRLAEEWLSFAMLCYALPCPTLPCPALPYPALLFSRHPLASSHVLSLSFSALASCGMSSFA